MKRIHLIEDAEICLRPVEQIAHIVAAPLTKPWNQTRTNTLLIFEIFQEQIYFYAVRVFLQNM